MFETFWGLEKVPAAAPPVALTIGNFDGVHRGHQRILQTTRDVAGRLECRAGVLIFDPHPMRVVAPGRAPALLSTPGQRLAWFERYGLGMAVVLRFDENMVRLSPAEFVEQVLVSRLGVRAVVVGRNFRFGHRQTGDFAVLERLGREHGFETHGVPPLAMGGELISSTRVREAILSGCPGRARRLLGRPFVLAGGIVKGQGIGSRLTVPTLNVTPETEVLPASGVYITTTTDTGTGHCWDSVSNVGTRPTFNGAGLTVETHLLGEPAGMAPRRVEVAFHHRLRDEQRFPSPELLRARILADVRTAERFFRRLRFARSRGVKTA